jgi:hypothetical protein
MNNYYCWQELKFSKVTKLRFGLLATVLVKKSCNESGRRGSKFGLVQDMSL